MRPRPIITLAATTVALMLVGGCNSSQEADQAAPGEEGSAAPAVEHQAGGMLAQMSESCPVMTEGVQVAVSDTDDGIALAFTTASGDVPALRARARHMAGMYSGGRRGLMWHAMGGRGPGMMGGGQGAGMMGGSGDGHGQGMAYASGMMPAATATVEDVDGGARILVVPTDAAQLEALREHARFHAQRMRSGECPMLLPDQD